MSKIIVCVPTIRPESHAKFVEAWKPLFERHKVTLITVWDGENPRLVIDPYDNPLGMGSDNHDILNWAFVKPHRDLFCRFTDGCRNIGFVAAAQMMDSPDDVLLTLDDDCYPCNRNGWDESKSAKGYDYDPIQAHIDALNKHVPISWMNTAHNTDLYLRGFPYNIRDEAPVMMSHGVWVGTPDFDGETQLKLEDSWKGAYVDIIEDIPNPDKHEGLIPTKISVKGGGVPYSLPYYVGPIPKGVLAPICGMNLAVKRDAIPYLYFAPMGRDTGIEGLNRFADIWMGVFLKREFDNLGWAVYTGASTILHSRASDAGKNYEQEKLGREWNEHVTKCSLVSENILKYVANDYLPSGSERGSKELYQYLINYADKRTRFKDLITSITGKKT